MPDVEINDLVTIGLVKDTPPHMLPPEALSTALNMRVVNGGWEKMAGWEQIFGTPSVAPHFAMAVRTAAATFWIYTSLTQAYGFDGTTHTNITRAAAATPYTATETRQWNGTFLGDIPIVNNGIDVPQFWSPISLATDLQDLTNWPATTRARVIRSFGPYLVAIGITKAGTARPHMVKWSHPADPGTVPVSWDETDPTRDAGENDLSDVQSGILLDLLPLAETMYLYKEQSTWKMRHVGGRFIFDFGKSAWLPTTGILAPRCVAVTRDGLRHVLATQDDIIWHDGNRVRSVLTERMRDSLFNDLDTTNYVNSFMFDNPLAGEMWFCYPSSGQANPNKALVMHYARGGEVWPCFEVDGITFRNAAVGPIEGASEDGWEDDELTWEADEQPWSETTRRRVILCGTAATKFYNLDKGITRDGTEFSGMLQRQGLAVLGKKRDGSWIVDWNRFKLMDAVWPKIQGGVVTIRFGAQIQVDGSVAWLPSVAFDPTTQNVQYPGPVSGRGLAIEFSGASQWRIDGYMVPVTDLGVF